MSARSFSGESEITNCETPSSTTSSPSSSWSAALKEDEVLFVALGKDTKENGPVLSWALKNLRGVKRVCLLYVHQPAQRMRWGVSQVSTGTLDEQEVKAYNDKERADAYAVLDMYVEYCNQRKLEAEKMCVEMNSIEEGLVQLISENGVRKLVMGAAANESYSKKMRGLKSRKAKHVFMRAPRFCHIWFVCNGNHICTRESSHDTSRDLIRAGSRIRGNFSDGSQSPSSKSRFLASSSLDLGECSNTKRDAGDDELYGRRDQLVADAENIRKEAHDESMKRTQAQKDIVFAIHQFTGRIEEEVAKRKEEAEKMRSKLDKLMKELVQAEEEKISLKQRIANSEEKVQELEEKLYAAVELSEDYKKERDELLDQVALVSQPFTVFSLSDLKEATGNFSKELEIGEGGYGSIYRGDLRHTEVAVKMLRLNSSQGPQEFEQEVSILSKLRHPNIVALIGACPENHALVYEYLPNGSLEDRLNRKNNTPPLPWKTRINIAVDLCSALVFLHHLHPCGVVHGDLKPGNVLLDANLAAKLGDFGISRVLPRDKDSMRDTTRCFRTDAKGSFAYIDPVFMETREITTKSDVFAFGIVLLRLLTGRPAFGLRSEVKSGLDREKVSDLLDPTAGDWPLVHAKQLAYVAVQCCNKKRSYRPDLESVWRVLEPMKRTYAQGV